MKRNAIIAVIAALSFSAAQAAQVQIPGVLLEEHWNNGVLKGAIENGTAGAPNWLNLLPSFRIPVNTANNYAERVSALFTAPVTGDYVFIVSSDDTSDLYLSTDSTPANKVLIAQQPGWNSADQWVSDAGAGTDLQQRWSSTYVDSMGNTPFASGIHLIGGTQYYLEGVMNEFGGGDNFAAMWKLISDPDPNDGDPSNFTNSLISATVTAPTHLDITTQPQDTTVLAGLSASFSVVVSTDSQIAPAYQWQRGGTNITGATGPSYSFVTSAADDQAQFDCVVTIPYLTNTVTSTTAKVTVQTGGVTILQALKQEYWTGQNKAAVEGGFAGAPTFVTVYTNFESPSNIADNFARRVSGLFTPAVSGNYVFFITSDDDSDLFLSTDSTAANKQLIAQEVGWSGVRTWTSDGGANAVEPGQKRSDQFSPDNGMTTPFSAGIALTAGTPYYIEAVHQEGGGGDNLAVTFKMVADPDPVDGSVTPPGDPPAFTPAEISFITKPVTTLTIASQPQSTNVFEGLPYSFSIAVQTDCELTPLYQWRKDGTNITGANFSTYSVGLAALTDSGQYDCVVTLPAGFPQTVTSTAATLNVQQSVFVSAELKYEYWPGATVATVENGTAGAPAPVGPNAGSTDSGYISSFETVSGFADNYANRISGFFIPPVTGAYVFFVSSDDQSDLFVSTDDKPANKLLVAQETGWSSSRTWASGTGEANPGQLRSDTWSPDGGTTVPYAAGINMTAGHRYYIEGVHNEGGGGDSFAATFKLVTDPDPLDGDAPKFAGSAVGVLAPQPTTLTITQQPQDTAGKAYDYTGAKFSVGVTTDSVLPPAYQWRRNGVPVPSKGSSTLPVSGRNATYTFIVSPSDATATYDCVVTIPGFTNTVTSTTAKVTVVNNGTIVQGALLDEYFSGNTRLDVEGLAASLVTPTVTTFTNFEAPTNIADNYAQRVSGFFTPATSGNYVFIIATDDDSDLFLSTDDQPANKRLIAQETGWSGVRNWTTSNGGSYVQKRSDTFVDPNSGTAPFTAGIPLTAGTPYYIEAVHHEGGGGDNLAVTFKLIADPDWTDGDDPAFTQAMLSYVQPATVATQPTITVTVGTGSLSVAWAPAVGRLQQSAAIGSAANWSDVSPQANPATIPIGASGNLFLRVVTP